MHTDPACWGLSLVLLQWVNCSWCLCSFSSLDIIKNSKILKMTVLIATTLIFPLVAIPVGWWLLIPTPHSCPQVHPQWQPLLLPWAGLWLSQVWLAIYSLFNFGLSTKEVGSCDMDWGSAPYMTYGISQADCVEVTDIIVIWALGREPSQMHEGFIQHLSSFTLSLNLW